MVDMALSSVTDCFGGRGMRVCCLLNDSNDYCHLRSQEHRANKTGRDLTWTKDKNASRTLQSRFSRLS